MMMYLRVTRCFFYGLLQSIHLIHFRGRACGLPDREVGRVLGRFPVVSPCLPGVWCRCCVRLRWHDWLTRS